MSEKTEELRKSLLRAPKNGYDRIGAEEKAEMERYCRDYMKFMDAAKTEREAVTYTIEKAEAAGTRFMLVEQDDCRGEDPFECLRRSYDYLRSWGFR